ncbi:MAG: DUF4130 domain-containing protein [Promethearchaeota archaeon]
MEKCQDPLKINGRFKGYSREELLKNLPRHCKYTPHIKKQINKIPDVILRNSGTPLAKKLNRMMKEVSLETYRAKQFTRTEINDRGVLYGIVLLKHDVIDLVLKYFHDRWPQCIICLYNEHSFKTSIINERGIITNYNIRLREFVDKISRNRPIIPYFKDIQFSGEKIFETLYQSSFIEERDNPLYFKKMIPDYCYELPGMRKGVERRFNNKIKKIDEFL